jgi:hypothetical protein
VRRIVPDIDEDGWTENGCRIMMQKEYSGCPRCSPSCSCSTVGCGKQDHYNNYYPKICLVSDASTTFAVVELVFLHHTTTTRGCAIVFAMIGPWDLGRLWHFFGSTPENVSSWRLRDEGTINSGTTGQRAGRHSQCANAAVHLPFLPIPSTYVRYVTYTSG